MSPFTQLTNPPFNINQNHYTSIDRNLNPLLSFLDEFDRHFSHRHRFMTCFIPRFDLEEDQDRYYLYGELPGAKVEEVGVEVQDGNKLIIWGATRRDGLGRNEGREGEEEFVNVKKEEAGHENLEDGHNSQEQQTNGKGKEAAEEPNPPRQLHHPTGNITQGFQHGYVPAQTNPNAYQAPPTNNSNIRVLLSERLVGEFNRTFAFPSPIAEEGIQASMEDGVLKVIVPKRLPNEKEKGKRVPIFRGKGRKSQDGKREVVGGPDY